MLSAPLSTVDVAPLAELLRGKRTLVLTGAGCSTESGIPDYRGPETRKRARNPIQHREFVTSAAARQRYWARSALGWPRFAEARPNDGHRALAQLQSMGSVSALLTQNVDRLHQAAGSTGVVELHGALHEARCLQCGAVEPRSELQGRILDANPNFDRQPVELAPDGDAELSRDAIASFVVPACLACGGVLKPDVVFFGDSVPREKVEHSFALLDASEALLVVGSSLAVFSGYRFVLRATERGMPIALVNLGESRGDAHANLRLDARAGEVLPELARALG
ncbi:MAG: NAD-dependent protein deacetylase [Deltaproteobacteria bacterium]|nr:NAD-dependent protein deacetylase [Deltaproteobacteria bacterium]